MTSDASPLAACTGEGSTGAVSVDDAVADVVKDADDVIGRRLIAQGMSIGLAALRNTIADMMPCMWESLCLSCEECWGKSAWVMCDLQDENQP